MAPQTPQQMIPSGHSPSLGTLWQRVLFYVAWILATCLLFLRPLTAFITYSLSNDNASHLVLIPVISAWLLFLGRDRIFKLFGSDVRAAALFLTTATPSAILAYFLGRQWSALNQLSVYVLGLILLWVAGFAFFFGRPALYRAKFPLVFLTLT